MSAIMKERENDDNLHNEVEAYMWYAKLKDFLDAQIGTIS